MQGVAGSVLGPGLGVALHNSETCRGLCFDVCHLAALLGLPQPELARRWLKNNQTMLLSVHGRGVKGGGGAMR